MTHNAYNNYKYFLVISFLIKINQINVKCTLHMLMGFGNTNTYKRTH